MMLVSRTMVPIMITSQPASCSLVIGALKSVFGERTTPMGVIALGSVKSMISHCIPAAGIASAQANARTAQLDLNRYGKLAQQGWVSDQGLQTAKAAAERMIGRREAYMSGAA